MGINLITDDIVNANARCRYHLGDTNGPGNGATYDFDTEVYNIANFTNNGTGVITVPVAGTYHFEYMVSFLAASAGDNVLNLVQNGSTAIDQSFISSGGADGKRMGGSTTFQLDAGDTIELRQSGLGAPNMNGGNSSYLTIERLADYSAGSAAGFGLATETVPGLVKAPRFMRKELQSNDTNSAIHEMSDFRYTGLTPNTYYRFTLSAIHQPQSAGTGIDVGSNFFLRHEDGTTTYQGWGTNWANGSYQEILTVHTIVNIGSDTQIKLFRTGGGSGTTLVGAGSYTILEELPHYIETADW